jgi:alpha-galactosidase
MREMGLFLLSFFICSCVALNNGLGRLPVQGYNTWYDYQCKNINEANVLLVMDNFLRLDLPSYGYNYINLDDCWATHRLANGTIVADPQRFPHGIAWLAEQAHKRGLKLGIYTDRGNLTCAGRPGSKG